MKEKYNKKILNVYKISFNIKCEMLFLVANLKNNKNSRYKDPVSDYCDKEYKLFNSLINYKISNFEDIVYCNVTIKLARSYLIVLYNKFLDMYGLQVNGIYDNYECVRRKRKLRKMIKKNIDINDINCSITCFKAYLSLGNCYNNIKYLDKFRFVACDFSN